jgi:hypothetical protein
MASGVRPDGDASAEFHALVEQFVAGYPTMGHHMLAAADVRYVAAKLLLRNRSPLTTAGDLKLAACLFVLFVQEHLLYSQRTILGTPVHELYAELRAILRSTGASQARRRRESRRARRG